MSTKYLIVEGTDGSGKDTMCRRIELYLLSKLGPSNFKSGVEPNKSHPTEKKIREILGKPNPDPHVLYELFLENRKNLMDKVRSEQKHVFLSNRSWLSTTVYQGPHVGFDKVFEDHKDVVINASLTFVITADIDTCVERVGERKERDSMESRALITEHARRYIEVVEDDRFKRWLGKIVFVSNTKDPNVVFDEQIKPWLDKLIKGDL